MLPPSNFTAIAAPYVQGCALIQAREVVEMVELSRHLGPHKVVAITSHLESELRLVSDLIIDMGLIPEPCRLGLTPTASIAVMSAIADALALIATGRRNFRAKITAFAIRNPFPLAYR